AEDSLSMMGTLRYITSLDQRDSLVQSAAHYFVDGRMHVAFRQFEEGFKTLGFLDKLRAHPEIFEDLFTSAPKPLEAKDLSTLFQVDFSVPGKGECSPLTLEMVLEFASGASAVPPLGFPLHPVIEFLYNEDTKIFPEANTCAIVLRLPIHKQCEKFKSCMTEGILQYRSYYSQCSTVSAKDIH
uniref:HECT domain-containing protein n=1 Tax=Gouania willdenowi TaxID=441366 RepID=A0A8C5GWH5_GOUWI